MNHFDSIFPILYEKSQSSSIEGEAFCRGALKTAGTSELLVFDQFSYPFNMPSEGWGGNRHMDQSA